MGNNGQHHTAVNIPPAPILLNISSDGRAEGKGYLNKLDVEFPCEGGHLPLDTELPLSDAHRDDFIMSCAVPNTIKDIQVLHHDMAIQSHIKYLPGLNKRETMSKPSASYSFSSWTSCTCPGFKFRNNF